MKLTYLSYSWIGSNEANVVQVMKMCDAFEQVVSDFRLITVAKNSNVHAWRERYGVSAKYRYHILPVTDFPVVRALIPIFGSFILLLFSRPDLVYARHAPLLYVCCLLKIPFVYEVHQLSSDRLYRFSEKFILKSSVMKGVVTISNALALDFCKEYNMSTADVFVAHDAADYIPGNAEVSSVSRDVGYVGSLHPGKGVELIIELAKAMPTVRFVIVGGEEHQLEGFKSRVNTNNIHFLGQLKRTELAEHYQKFRVMLLPLMSRSQGAGSSNNISRWTSPLKLFEYMSYGKAIVASKLPVLEEVLQEDVHVKLVSPEDIPKWVSTIEKLLENDELCDRLSRSALQLQRCKYTWVQRANNVLGAMDV